MYFAQRSLVSNGLLSGALYDRSDLSLSHPALSCTTLLLSVSVPASTAFFWFFEYAFLPLGTGPLHGCGWNIVPYLSPFHQLTPTQPSVVSLNLLDGVFSELLD